jgi:hypothetical protein
MYFYMFDSKIINIQCKLYQSCSRQCQGVCTDADTASFSNNVNGSHSLTGNSKNAGKSALAENDLKQDKLARQSALIGRLFQTVINLELRHDCYERLASYYKVSAKYKKNGGLCINKSKVLVYIQVQGPHEAV